MKILLLVLVAASGSHLSLEGSSNVKDWRCSGTTLDGRMDVAAPLEQINQIIDRIEDGDVARLDPRAASFPQPKFQLRVPVQSLRCGNRQMERDMFRALRADANPVIEFQFNALVGGVEHDIDARRYRATISGVLTLAGTRRTVQIPVEAERIGRDRFRLRARLPLRMTDFSITPPTALFGIVKANDELVVQFELVLGVRT
ncbi:MAG TPA: YceI family protein [Thermoanaerobaculia bacterium]|nr:YceI family protein [Thermoanaerobaculia bacterium]